MERHETAWPRWNSLRVAVSVASLVLLMGCVTGGPVLRGYLFYAEDTTLATTGDSVWININGTEDIGVTVPVGEGNAWEYNPKKKNSYRVWQDEAPSLVGSANNGQILRIRAIAETTETKVHALVSLRNYNKDSAIVLYLSQKGAGHAPDTNSIPPPGDHIH